MTHEEVTSEELGGAKAHATKSGVTHFTARRMKRWQSIEHIKRCPQLPCLRIVKRSLMRLDYAGRGRVPDPKLDSVVPESAQQPYDIRHVVLETCAMPDPFTEVQKDHYAENMVCGFARISRPEHRCRCEPARFSWRAFWTSRLRRKAARFVRTCDAFNVPLLVVLEDVPWFSPWYRSGMERHHYQRRQAALCIQRGDGAADYGDHTEGLRRRV